MMPTVLVRDLGGDGRGLLAHLVTGLAVRGHAGHLDGRAVDDDLHLIHVVLAQAGVLQPDLIQGAGNGGKVLIDGAAGLGRDHFRVGVAIRAVLLEFDRVRAVLQTALVLAAFLVGPPGELGPVEAGPVHPSEAGVGVLRVPHVLSVVRVDARVSVRHVAWRVNGLPAAVGKVFEVAVYQVVRQFRRVGGEPDFAVGLGLGGLGGVLLATLVRRNLTGRIGRILVISKLVRLGEHDVVDEVAARGVASLGALERESGHGRGGDVHAGVRLPFGLAALGRNGLGRHAGPVAAAIGRGAGGVLRRLLAWTAYHDLHGVDVGCVLARVLQAPPVHDARRGGDVLVDVFVRGFGDDLRETVHFLAVVVRLVADLHAMLEFLMRVRLLVGTQALLAAVPAEFGPVPVGDGHELASVIHVEAAPAGRRIHVAAVLAVRAGRIVERAVDDMVRQA